MNVQKQIPVPDELDEFPLLGAFFLAYYNIGYLNKGFAVAALEGENAH